VAKRLTNQVVFGVRNTTEDSHFVLDEVPDLSVVLVYCGQTVRWIRMPLRTEVGLDPGHIVLDVRPSCPPPPKRRTPQFSAHDCCGQTAGWIKIPLGTEVCLGPGDIVLDGDLAPFPHPSQKGGTAAPPLSAHGYC